MLSRKTKIIPASTEELISRIKDLEADRNEKMRRLQIAFTRLNRARVTVKNQKEILKRLRERVVELTPAENR